MDELSARQRQILEFIRRFVEEHDYPPSIRQIQEGCGLSSTSVADYNLRLLERRGYVRRAPGWARAIELLGPAGRQRPRLVPVPLVGAIAAGEPIPVPGEDAWLPSWEEVLELPASMVGNRQNVFAVRVRGNSMVDALVHDGDIVVLEPTPAIRDGEMAAVWLKREGAATLKRLYREGDRVRLQPANEAMAPIYVEAEGVEVQGRVVAVLRSLA
ncbi:MAG: transcriptional repressor LexA [Chloroflexota bacterium]|nr:transcriptional repressor LexA [Chloroflexota bacterium]